MYTGCVVPCGLISPAETVPISLLLPIWQSEESDWCSTKSDLLLQMEHWRGEWELTNALPVWQSERLSFAAHRRASHCYNRLVFKWLFIHCEVALRHLCTGISLFGATRSRGAVLTEQGYFVNKHVHQWPFFYDSDETSGGYKYIFHNKNYDE